MSSMLQDKIHVRFDIKTKEKIDEWKSQDCAIVFTNGCFDLLHLGHVVYLQEAKSLGQKLIVGLNNDTSVKNIKGHTRPIKDETNRSYILAALESVDMVIIFEDETPEELVKSIKPDIIVKGGDWKPDQIIGADWVLSHGGQVHSLRFVEGISTTHIVEKIRLNKP